MRKVLSLIVRDIESNKYIIAKYINLNIYVLGHHLNNRPVEALFRYIAFIIDNFRAKMLIEINIFVVKNIDLIIFTRIDYVDSYNIIFELIVISLVRLFIK